MARKVRIGYNEAVDDYGIFVSKPGRDVLDASTNYLLDSRFRTLSIMTHGKVTMTKQNATGGVIWYAEVSFADPGYRPIFYANITYDAPNSLDIPVNSAGIPISSCGRGAESGIGILNSSVWMVGNNVIRAKAAVNTDGNSSTMSLYYIVFNNRFE